MANPVYVPILKGKEGEFSALETLREGVPDRVMPVIELPTVPFDYANERPARPIAEHVDNVVDRLRRAWGTRAVYLDVPWSDENDDDRSPLDLALRRCSAAEVQAIPVVSRQSTEASLQAAAQFTMQARSSFCVRLFVADFEDDVDVEIEVERLSAPFGQSARDLIIDLADISNSSNPAQLVARSILGMIPAAASWRRIILAAASFPVDLSDVDAATVTTIPRREWQLWQSLQRRRTGLPQQGIVYGDYAIAHPLPRELDPRIMVMSASIRYTSQENWVVVKGRNVRQYGFEQYFELCRTLVDRAEFRGRDFSWGDEYIARCAARELGPGKATTWRKVGTNHHITLVVRELAGR